MMATFSDRIQVVANEMLDAWPTMTPLAAYCTAAAFVAEELARNRTSMVIDQAFANAYARVKRDQAMLSGQSPDNPGPDVHETARPGWLARLGLRNRLGRLVVGSAR